MSGAILLLVEKQITMETIQYHEGGTLRTFLVNPSESLTSIVREYVGRHSLTSDNNKTTSDNTYEISI